MTPEWIVGRSFLQRQLFKTLDRRLVSRGLMSVVVVIALRITVNLLLDVLLGKQHLLLSSLRIIELIELLNNFCQNLLLFT